MVAEKEAWKIAEQHGLDLVTIHPVFVVGPVLSSRTDETSVQMIVVRTGEFPTLQGRQGWGLLLSRTSL